MSLLGAFRERRPFPGQDPWIVAHDGSLLLVQSGGGNRRIVVKRFHDLEHMDRNTETVIWTPRGASAHLREVWAPELHDIEGRWYVYFAASDGRVGGHRAYALVADDPLGPYRELGPVFDPANDVWAIDLTVFSHGDRRYAVWSGWEGHDEGGSQNLYIAPMSNPWTISGPSRCLSRPEHGWEMTVAPVNEGPEVIRHPGSGRLFLLYAADASWTQAYKMGLLEWTGGEVTDPASWQKLPYPFLAGGGHGCVVDTPAGTRLVYHRKVSGDPGWADREIRWVPLTWDAAGYPVVRATNPPPAAVAALSPLGAVGLDSRGPTGFVTDWAGSVAAYEPLSNPSRSERAGRDPAMGDSRKRRRRRRPERPAHGGPGYRKSASSQMVSPGAQCSRAERRLRRPDERGGCLMTARATPAGGEALVSPKRVLAILIGLGAAGVLLVALAAPASAAGTGGTSSTGGPGDPGEVVAAVQAVRAGIETRAGSARAVAETRGASARATAEGRAASVRASAERQVAAVQTEVRQQVRRSRAEVAQKVDAAQARARGARSNGAAVGGGPPPHPDGTLYLLQPDPTIDATFIGRGALSTDGVGGNGGLLQAEVPAGSTVVGAYLYGYFLDGNPTAAQRTVNLDGTPVALAKIDDYGLACCLLSSARADVTPLVAAKVGSGGGIFNFSVAGQPNPLDGIALAVIYENPALPVATIAILDGSAIGDTATFRFDAPLDKTLPGFQARLVLGSGFSFQQEFSGNNCGVGSPVSLQATAVDVNGSRLTSCAGGTDDGWTLGAFTVGGVGDLPDNPADPFQQPGDNAVPRVLDDELYDLGPFMNQGDTELVVYIAEPKGYDILFFAGITVTAQATATTEACNDGIDNDGDGLLDSADPACAPPPPIVGPGGCTVDCGPVPVPLPPLVETGTGPEPTPRAEAHRIRPREVDATLVRPASLVAVAPSVRDMAVARQPRPDALARTGPAPVIPVRVALALVALGLLLCVAGRDIGGGARRGD